MTVIVDCHVSKRDCASCASPAARDVDYDGVRGILDALDGRRIRIALMTAIGLTNRASGYHGWKLRSERLVSASGHPYTIMRLGWFDMNDPDQHQLRFLQGDRRWAGSPAECVAANMPLTKEPPSVRNDRERISAHRPRLTHSSLRPLNVYAGGVLAASGLPFPCTSRTPQNPGVRLSVRDMDLIGDLVTRSDAFQLRWAAHNVRHHGTGIKRILHPEVGDLELVYEAMDFPADPDWFMFGYTAEPGRTPPKADLSCSAVSPSPLTPPIVPRSTDDD